MQEQHMLYQQAGQALSEGKRILILSRQSAASAPIEKTLFAADELSAGQNVSNDSLSLAQAALQQGKLQYQELPQGGFLMAEPYFPEARLIILGGGHIAVPLAEFAAKCGFTVSVVDDRPAFANTERFPFAKQVLCESFHTCFPQLHINASCFVVIITRGHRHDMDCLRSILPQETAYTGMIGSRRRVKGAMAQLMEEGFPKEDLARVHAPIGLPIGAITPEEIAISILSQLIAVKRQGGALYWPELDRAVLAALSRVSEESRALVTIVQTKGSVPREAGAKMLVWPYGKIIGSIGGGCSESAVMQTAYGVIRSDACERMEVDMTGSVAEEEGMVCGGIMKVLIEPI